MVHGLGGVEVPLPWKDVGGPNIKRNRKKGRWVRGLTRSAIGLVRYT